MAKEKGYDLVVFTRDRDKEAAREEAISEGIRKAPEIIQDAPRIVGGVAIEETESWIIALAGRARSPKMGEVQRRQTLAGLGVREKCTADMVRIVEQADLESLPKDAKSLKTWIERARTMLSADSSEGP